jgi:hypothetical protein
LDDRISCIVTAESESDGTIRILLRAVDGASGFNFPRAVFTFSMWQEDQETVRLSVMNPRTGAVAYLQGGPAAIAFMREAGLELIP